MSMSNEDHNFILLKNWNEEMKIDTTSCRFSLFFFLCEPQFAISFEIICPRLGQIISNEIAN